MNNLKTVWQRLRACRNGSTAVEYSLLGGLIALSLVVGLTQLGSNVSKPIDCTNGVIQGQTKEQACK